MNAKHSNAIWQLLPNIIVVILLGMASISTNGALNLAAVVISMIAIMFLEKENAFYLLIQVAAFESMITISGRNVFSILVLLFCIKLMFSKRTLKMNTTVFLSLLVLIFLECINDNPLITNASPFSFVNVVSYMLLFAIWISNFDTMKIDISKLMIAFDICIVIIIFVTFLSYGSISQFISASKEASYVYRLGANTRDSLAGAMGIPLFASICVAMNIVYLMVNKNKSTFVKAICLISIGMSVLGGVLSVSRSFYLCLLSFFAFFVLFSFADKKNHKQSFFIILVFIVAVICFLTVDAFDWIISNIMTRSEQDSGIGIRGDIWISILQYVSSHIKVLLFGMGTINYPSIGESLGELFSYSAHNIFLDILISYGIIGLTAMLSTVAVAFKKLKSMYGSMKSKYCILPLLIFLSYGLTALRTFSGKTWIYFIMLITFAYLCGKDITHKETMQNEKQ